MSRARELVEDVLSRLPQPFTEDVTHQVFEAIENDPAWRREYDALCEERDASSRYQTGRHSLNQSIGHFVKKITGREVLSQGNPTLRSTLIKTYSKLG